MFEEYFSGEQPELLSENISTKTVMIFKDPNPIRRAVTKINWHPEATTDLRVGVSYAMLRFQQMPPKMPLNSYIWNLNNPNAPEKTLSPPSSLCTMVFNHKNSDIIVGGSYNGSLSFFDQRKGNSSGVIKPVETTMLDKSHHDPVYDIYWLTVGKSGTECVSTSTDGRILWWDMKKLGDGPVDELILSETFQVNDQPVTKILGGTCLEYNQDAGPLKYLIGTEQGYILQANKRKAVEIQTRFGLESGKHHGPVYALQRNPAHTKFFLSVGDWTAKIWSEELKTPIMQTRYHSSYLTSGCWSPSRCGLFFLTRMDGFLDVWDFFYRQNEVAYSQKISDSPLTAISVQGQMAAIGDADGTVSMMSLCRALYDQTLQPKEKEIMASIFDREFRREKNLDVAKRQAELKKPVKKDNTVMDKRQQMLQQQLEELEQGFFKHVAEDQDQLSAIKKRGDGGAAEVSAPKQPAAAPQAPPKEAVAPPKEEPKKEVVVAAPVKASLTMGEHVFKGQVTQEGGEPIKIEFLFKVEEGGIISSQPTEAHKYSLNGVVHDGKLTLKQQFSGEGDHEAEFDGEFEGATLNVKGTYKSNNKDVYPAGQGTFELSKQ